MDVTSFLQTLSPHDVPTIVSLLGSGAGVAVTLQVIKHFGKLQEAKKLVAFLLGALSFLASYTDWFLQYSSQNPKVVIGAHLGWTVTAAIFIHRFAVSPAYKVYAGYSAYEKEQAALQAQNVAAPAQEFSLGL